MRPLFLLALLGFAASPVLASPVTASFGGAVSGYAYLGSGIFASRPEYVQSDFPVGTAVSYTFTFDDAFKNDPESAFGQEQDVSGWLRIGGLDMSLDNFSITQVGSNSFGFRIWSDNPATTAAGQPFSGIWLFTDLGVTASGVALVGFGDLNGYIADNGWMTTSGAVAFAAAEVPEPGSLALVLASLGLMAAVSRPFGRRSARGQALPG
ncbi:MAG: PEP-CTERM sorting domain-containing protein [Rubrivivax sp.]